MASQQEERRGKDEQEKKEVAEILEELPDGHPAREAFALGEPTWAIARMLRDYPDLVLRLSGVVVRRHGRILRRLQAERRKPAGVERRQVRRQR